MNEERKYLERMAKKHRGLLMVDDELEAARDENCVLHKHFEWDDTEAAEQYRREQARTLIQKCKITIANAPSVSVRAFVSLSDDQRTGGGYRLTAEVLSDTQMRDQLLRDIQMTIARWSQKLHLLDSETAEIIEQLSRIIEHKANKHQHRVAA